MNSNKKVVVGMSGGVDSSVTAALLQEQGYEVIGVTCNFWWDGAESDIKDARKVADTLGIPFHVYDFAASFRRDVIEPFIDSYLCGRTPSPCALCNRVTKWRSLLMAADLYGAQYIATGHYSYIDKLENGRYSVRNADCNEKDQSYFLYNLTQEQLSRTLLPLGPYSKDEIRAIAEKKGLPVAHKHDSQDICFFYGSDYGKYIKEEAPGRIPPEGNFVSPEGEVLGKHKGILHYTLGQRKGLGIALGRPVFVSKIDPVRNEVTLSDEDALFANTLIADNVNYMGEESFSPDKVYYGKTRYTHKGTPCHVSTISDSQIQVTFDDPVRAMTPGQAVVIYSGEHVAGGGTICEVI